jgi:hypothetical protein
MKVITKNIPRANTTSDAIPATEIPGIIKKFDDKRIKPIRMMRMITGIDISARYEVNLL